MGGWRVSMFPWLRQYCFTKRLDRENYLSLRRLAKRYIRMIETTIPTLTQRTNLKLTPPATAKMPPVLLPNVICNTPANTSMTARMDVITRKPPTAILKMVLSVIYYVFFTVLIALNACRRPP